MSAAAKSVAAPAALAQAASPPVLQRACACGSHGAGPSGRCEACEARARLGAPAALAVGPPDDAFEQEAERIAEAVVAGRAAGTVTSLPATAARRAAATQHAPTAPSRATLAAATRGGRPLGPALRAEFEPRFGRDLSHLRLHDGPPASALSRALGARAVAHGGDILFAAGQLDEGTAAGRRLLAHEIAHTVQQGAAAVLRRAPAEEAEAPTKPMPSEVVMTILESPTGVARNLRLTNYEDGRFTFHRPVYPLDSVHLRLDAQVEGVEPVEGPLAVRFEPGDAFERSDTGDDSPTVALRVVWQGPGETEARAFITAPNVSGEMEVVFRIGVLPLDIDPVIDVRKRKRAERKTMRQEQRRARQELRRERREGDETRDFGDERRALRERQREERQAFREGRLEALDEAREARKAGIAEARAAHGQFACTKSQRSLVESAMREAIGRLDAALRNIRPGEPLDDYRSQKLQQCFNVDPATAAPAELDRIQIRAKDVLNIARNSMLLSDPGTVRCGAPAGDCKPRAAAFVTDSVRGNPVTLCQIWLDDNLEFEATKLEPGHERAYALIHEFCHLAGVVDQTAETYLHEPEWQGLGSAEALTMADAYAAFAWYMSSPGLE